MSESLKNVVVFIICIVLVGGGYYVMKGDTGVDAEGNNLVISEELITKTQAFIERSNKLQKIKIDPSFFTDEVFTSLRSFSTDVPEQPVGRNDIFSEAKTVDSVVANTVE